ncbi:hypothetical protein BRDID11002_28500 [Bradyrhizobium diazoefficiens]
MVRLYLAVIVVVMLGWAHSGAHAPDYSDFFGLFHVPQFTSPDRAAANAYEDRHILFAYVLLALIAVHVVAALWHHFIRRDPCRDADGGGTRRGRAFPNALLAISSSPRNREAVVAGGARLAMRTHRKRSLEG